MKFGHLFIRYSQRNSKLKTSFKVTSEQRNQIEFTFMGYEDNGP